MGMLECNPLSRDCSVIINFLYKTKAEMRWRTDGPPTEEIQKSPSLLSSSQMDAGGADTPSAVIGKREREKGELGQAAGKK